MWVSCFLLWMNEKADSGWRVMAPDPDLTSGRVVYISSHPCRANTYLSLDFYVYLETTRWKFMKRPYTFDQDIMNKRSNVFASTR